MTVGIIHDLLYLLLELLAPGSGRRRAGTLSAAPARQGVRRSGPARGTATRPRSPYGLVEMLDGEDAALVRPYLVEHERQEERAARQQRRRLSLVMAADFGIDLDTRDVHAVGVAW
ncbi:hypothetical protein AB0M68_05260 [Streptomyces sp. NPDC051453]|uniref:hypothetical protein n=1 Tax=Streptomyces sp. NPDC051453 TaxID=3154941 RepID=UPI00343FA27C